MSVKGEWTPARKHAFIVSVLRTGTRRWPPKFQVLEEAKTEKKINKKTGRVAQHYRCAHCSLDFSSTNIQVDHEPPIVGPNGFTTWDDYIERMFCGKEGLQVLCLACHKIKSHKERQSRGIGIEHAIHCASTARNMGARLSRAE